MVVGKFNSDASDTVANTITTSRGVTIQNNTGTEFSADFGDYYPSFVRHIGVNSISDWSNNRNLDFWHGVPNGRQWKRFWTNGRSSGMDSPKRRIFNSRDHGMVEADGQILIMDLCKCLILTLVLMKVHLPVQVHLT